MNNWINYTGAEWLLVDIASRYGMDKDHFDVRIEWAKELIPLVKAATSESMLTILMKPYIDKADEPAMFCGAILALWDTINGRVSTWQVGMDAASSGPQLLSVLLKDLVGMEHTGILGTHVPDLYTAVTVDMNAHGGHIERKIVKKGIIPHVYASEREPKKVFKKEYPRFLKSYKNTVKKAQEASDFMVSAWNPFVTEHTWTMPDGAHIRVPVLVQQKKTLPLGKHTFEFIYEELGTVKRGSQGTKSLSANTTHSYDAYMLRELNRRANYDPEHIKRCLRRLETRDTACCRSSSDNDRLLELEGLFFSFNQVSAVAFEYIDEANAGWITPEYTTALVALAKSMLSRKPFEVSNIHDEFKCLPNHVTHMKYIYNQLICDTYLSNWWTKTAEHLTGTDVSFMADAVNTQVLPEIMQAAYSIG